MTKKPEPARIRYEKRKISELIPDEGNPRAIDKKARKRLGASLKRFGLVQPIVVNERDGGLHIVGGHQRLNELRDAGEAEVMVAIGAWTLAEERALNVTLNNPGNQGEFSEGLTGYLDSVSSSLSALDFLALGIDHLLPDPEGKKARKGREADGGLTYKIVITCTDEQHQAGLLDRLEAEGLTAAPLIA